MKLQAIKGICTKTKRIVILDTLANKQWIGDGAGMYPVEGVYFHPENILAVMGINEKQADKINLRQMEMDDPRFDIHPSPQEEILLERKGPDFYWNGNVIRALVGPEGLIFINTAYLKPMERGDGMCEYYLRKREGVAPVIATYADMLVGAIISPLDMNEGKAIKTAFRDLFFTKLHQWDEPSAEEPEEQSKQLALLSSEDGEPA